MDNCVYYNQVHYVDESRNIAVVQCPFEEEKVCMVRLDDIPSYMTDAKVTPTLTDGEHDWYKKSDNFRHPEYRFHKPAFVDQAVMYTKPRAYRLREREASRIKWFEQFGVSTLDFHRFTTLGQYMDQADVLLVVEVAQRVNEILDNLETMGIIHGFFSGEHVLVHTETGEVKLIEFIMASENNKEDPMLANYDRNMLCRWLREFTKPHYEVMLEKVLAGAVTDCEVYYQSLVGIDYAGLSINRLDRQRGESGTTLASKLFFKSSLVKPPHFDGSSLSDLMKTPPLSADVHRLMWLMLDRLYYLGIVYGSLEPGNIFISKNKSMFLAAPTRCLLVCEVEQCDDFYPELKDYDRRSLAKYCKEIPHAVESSTTRRHDALYALVSGANIELIRDRAAQYERLLADIQSLEAELQEALRLSRDSEVHVLREAVVAERGHGGCKEDMDQLKTELVQLKDELVQKNANIDSVRIRGMTVQLEDQLAETESLVKQLVLKNITMAECEAKIQELQTQCNKNNATMTENKVQHEAAINNLKTLCNAPEKEPSRGDLSSEVNAILDAMATEFNGRYKEPIRQLTTELDQLKRELVQKNTEIDSLQKHTTIQKMTTENERQLVANQLLYEELVAKDATVAEFETKNRILHAELAELRQRHAEVAENQAQAPEEDWNRKSLENQARVQEDVVPKEEQDQLQYYLFSESSSPPPWP